MQRHRPDRVRIPGFLHQHHCPLSYPITTFLVTLPFSGILITTDYGGWLTKKCPGLLKRGARTRWFCSVRCILGMCSRTSNTDQRLSTIVTAPFTTVGTDQTRYFVLSGNVLSMFLSNLKRERKRAQQR